MCPALVLAAALSAGACAPGGERAAESREGRRPARHDVTLRAIRFDPERLAIAPGDTVVWTNRDVVPHTVTAADRAWDSGHLAPESTWRTVIARPGAAPYVCSYHPMMKGTVVAAAGR